MLVALLAEVVLDQLGQGLHGLLLIAAVGDEGDGGALRNAQRQNAQQALGVDTALLLLHPDAALELVGLDRKSVV